MFKESQRIEFDAGTSAAFDYSPAVAK